MTVEGKKVQEIGETITPLLQGLDAELHGAVLAHLVALWLSAHRAKDDADGTKTMAYQFETLKSLNKLTVMLLGKYAEVIAQEHDPRRTN